MEDKFLILGESKECAYQTPLLIFEKPPGFSFAAGQYINLIVPSQSRIGGKIAKAFSIATAPGEDSIWITFRRGISEFKNYLVSLSLGSKVSFAGPLGKFLLPKGNNKPVVFLAGGIGITPMRSMIRDSLDKGESFKMYLFYSNRKPEDAAFLQELRSWTNERFTIITTMTDMKEKDDSPGEEIDLINGAMIRKYLGKELRESLYYVVGPTAFIQAIKEVLMTEGIEENQMKIDDFGPAA